MNIYFAASIRGGRNDLHVYSSIVDHLKTYGNVLSEHVVDLELPEQRIDITEKEIHDNDMRWIMESDVIVAEVSTPSLGVGYEIGRAIENGKKILCLYNTSSSKKLSAMITGSESLMLAEYEDMNQAFDHIDRFFN